MNHFPQRILLAVTGKSPQIVTETLYALTQTSEEPFFPTHIFLITTAEGAESARRNLLNPQEGEFHRLCQDYDLGPIYFTAENIQILPTTEGQPLSDIRTKADNKAAADFICQFLYRIIAKYPESSVHASIAGGRKTMGFYLAYALSLFGREQDRLSHVLVESDFEGNRDFFYPTPYKKSINTSRGSILDASQAKVELADIGFVRMNIGLRKETLEQLIAGKMSYDHAVKITQKALDRLSLHIDLPHRAAVFGDIKIPLRSVPLAFYAMIAAMTQGGFMMKRIEPDIPHYIPHAKKMLYYYRQLEDKKLRTLQKGMTQKYLQSICSELNRKLKTELGGMAINYQVKSKKYERATYYTIDLDPDLIAITELPANEWEF